MGENKELRHFEWDLDFKIGLPFSSFLGEKKLRREVVNDQQLRWRDEWIRGPSWRRPRRGPGLQTISRATGFVAERIWHTNIPAQQYRHVIVQQRRRRVHPTPAVAYRQFYKSWKAGKQGKRMYSTSVVSQSEQGKGSLCSIAEQSKEWKRKESSRRQILRRYFIVSSYYVCPTMLDVG